MIRLIRGPVSMYTELRSPAFLSTRPTSNSSRKELQVLAALRSSNGSRLTAKPILARRATTALLVLQLVNSMTGGFHAVTRLADNANCDGTWHIQPSPTNHPS